MFPCCGEKEGNSGDESTTSLKEKDQRTSRRTTEINDRNSVSGKHQVKAEELYDAVRKGNINYLIKNIEKFKNENKKNKERFIFCSMNKCQHEQHSSNEEKEKKCNHLKCFLFLLDQDGSEINDKFVDWTPLMFITMHYGFKEFEDKSAKSLTEKLNITLESLKLKEIYHAIEHKNDPDSRLRKLLEDLNRSQKVDTIFQIMYQRLTLTQAACSFGLLESAKWLIEKSSLYSQITPVSNRSPTHLACRQAQFEILKFLLGKKIGMEKTKNERTLLHLIIKSLMDSDPKKTYKCLKAVLEHDEIREQINDTDDYHKTALHYATVMKNDDCVFELLQNGAYIDEEDDWKRTPLEYIEPATLEKFLNAMISTPDPESNMKYVKENTSKKKKKSSIKNEGDLENGNGNGNPKKESETKEILFNFEHLLRKSSDSHAYTFSMNLLSRIRQQEDLKNLIAHPMLSLIIYFKWLSIRGLFIAYLLFYTLFCIIYVGYALIPNNSTLQDNETSIHTSKLVTTEWLTEMTCPTNSITLRTVTFIILNILYSILLLFELIKVISLLKFTAKGNAKTLCIVKYFKHADKIHLISIMTSTAGLACFIWEYTCRHFYYHKETVAVSVLINGVRLFFLFGQHPYFTYYAARFKSVLYKMFGFVIYHSILVFSFSLCFYILFRNVPGDNNFKTFGKSTFRTIIMLTAEYDTDSVPFKKAPIISHLIFVGFVLVTTIVLLELLSHTLTSAVKKIEEKPLLFKSLAQMDVIVYFEQYHLHRFKILRPILNCHIFQRFINKLTELPDQESSKEIKDVTILLKNKIILNKFEFEQNPGNEESKIIQKKAVRVLKKKWRKWIPKFIRRELFDEVDKNIVIDAGKIAMKNLEQKSKRRHPIEDINKELIKMSNSMESMESKFDNIINRIDKLEKITEKFGEMSATKKSESVQSSSLSSGL